MKRVLGSAVCLALYLSSSAYGIDLHDPSLDYTYVMIAHNSLYQAAVPLRDHRQNDYCGNFGNTHNVLLVTRSEVENEFGYGAVGIREFLSYAYHNWSEAPEYVLLIGDCDFVESVGDTLIPGVVCPGKAGHVFHDDSWYVCFDGAANSVPAMTVGRLPARTPVQVEAYVNKVLDYDLGTVARDTGDKLLFLCQDFYFEDERLGETTRVIAQDLIANCIEGLFDHEVMVASELGEGNVWERYPSWESEVLAKLNASAGSGAPAIIGGIASANSGYDFLKFLDVNLGFDMAKVSETGAYPFFVGASCSQGRFAVLFDDQEPYIPEMFLLAENKGAIGWIGPSGDHLSLHANYWLSQSLYPRLRETNKTAGRALLEAKVECMEQHPLERVSFRMYSFLGDPALVLFGDRGPYADLSSVWSDPDSVVFTCPLGDGQTLELGTQLVDCYGDPVANVPAAEIVATAYADSPGTVIASRGEQHVAESASDSQGLANLEIRHVGGCGDLIVDVYAQGNFIGQQTVHVKSPDLNGDCVVDAEDDGLFFEHLVVQNLCADFNGDGLVDGSDQTILYQHYASDGSKYHFSIDPAYSSATVNPSDPTCMVLCPKGDMDVFSTDVEARNARNEVFLHSAIPADSIWAQIPGADGIGFRLVCRDDPEVATADGPTSEPENTTITVNSAGGSCWAYYEWPPGDWPIKVYIGGQQVGEWTGFPKSPDIDASGVVNGTDFSLWSEDYFWCSLYTPPECRERYSRSDFDCNDTVDEADFDILNPHYKHRCGASSYMLAEGQSDLASWTDRDAEGIRSHLPNYVLDRFLTKDLHPELRTLLAHVRSMDEPDSLAVMGGETRAAAMSLMPQVTSMAQSVPNPFMGTAVIGYQMAPPGGRVRITIFDVAGRRVRVLVDGEKPPGFYVVPWDGKNDGGRSVASGVYFYQMKAPGFSSSKRMMLVK